MPAREILMIGIAAVSFGAGCADDAAARRVRPCYDEFTRALLALYADQNADGRVDQWSYLAGNRVLRGETDTNGDGRIDRWEYFDGQAALVKIGTSSLDDGIEDTWVWPAAGNGQSRVGHSRLRDRRVDRHEYFENGRLTRAEEDTDGDGRVDRWDRYEEMVLRQVEYDTTLTRGRPDRRVLYDAGGKFERVEAIEK